MTVGLIHMCRAHRSRSMSPSIINMQPCEPRPCIFHDEHNTIRWSLRHLDQVVISFCCSKPQNHSSATIWRHQRLGVVSAIACNCFAIVTALHFYVKGTVAVQRAGSEVCKRCVVMTRIARLIMRPRLRWKLNARLRHAWEGQTTLRDQP